MSDKSTYRFGVKHDRAWGWHIGVNFCIAPKDINGNREIYLFVCIGKHDFSIGFINFWEEA